MREITLLCVKKLTFGKITNNDNTNWTWTFTGRKNIDYLLSVQTNSRIFIERT